MFNVPWMLGRLVLAFTVAVLLMAAPPIQAVDTRPNIVYITLDDMNVDELGAYNSAYYTPTIDALAQQGVRFTNAHVTATVCTPSRYSFLTGRYASRSSHPHYLEEYPLGTPAHPDFEVHLEEEGLNLPSVLQAKGYRTGFIGKWHLSDHDVRMTARWPRMGLETYAADADPRDPAIDAKLKRNHQWWAERIKQFGFDFADSIYAANTRELFNVHLNHHNLEWTTAGALRFLDTVEDGHPFFLNVNVTVPHGPHPASRRGDGYPASIGSPIDLGSAGVIEGDFNVQPPRDTLIPRVLAAGKQENTFHVLWFDDSVAAIVNKLEAMGVRENTMIIIISDHGNETGSKSTLYDAGARVPLVIGWPEGTARPGQTYSGVVGSIDLAATIFDAAAITPPAEMVVDGTSLLPVLQGSDSPVRDALLLEMGDARAIRTDRWKYIAVRYPPDVQARIDAGETFPVPPNVARREHGVDEGYEFERPLWFSHGQLAFRAARTNPNYFVADQLYDLHADPNEEHNVIDRYPDVAEKMKAKLREQLLKFPDRPFGEFTE